MPNLQRATTLAFAGRLHEAERELGSPQTDDERWLRAYLHNCFGDFDTTLAIAMALAEDCGDARIASASLVTAASALRQLGRHLPAHPLDEGALALALDDGSKAHAHIGLAADAVGLAREAECAEHIDAAAVSSPRGDWRVRVRLAWVRAEHALLTARTRKAITHARDALDRSREAKARRHEAKSLLFLGVAMREAGDANWRRHARLAEDIATRIGAKPIAAEAAKLLPPRSAPTKRAAPAKRSTTRKK